MLTQEGYRAADRPWYDAEIKHAQSLATAASPMREPVYKAGILQLKEVNPGPPKHERPLLADAKEIADPNDMAARPPLPLASLEANQKEERKREIEWADQQKELQSQIDLATQYTERLTPAVGKGLLVRIEDEKVKVKRADEELAIVQPLAGEHGRGVRTDSTAPRDVGGPDQGVDRRAGRDVFRPEPRPLGSERFSTEKLKLTRTPSKGISRPTCAGVRSQGMPYCVDNRLRRDGRGGCLSLCSAE